MKKLLLTTALVAGFAFPATAQTTTAPAPGTAAETQVHGHAMFRDAHDPMEIRASDFMGMTVYSSANDYRDTPAVRADQRSDWESIGSVGDLILSRDGRVEAVIVDVGGFLGIGAREVAIAMSDIRFVADDDTAEDVSDYYLVVNTSREMLEGAPEYERVHPSRTVSADPAQAPAAGTAAAPAQTTAADPAYREPPTLRTTAPEGYELLRGEMRTVDTLTGATIYDAEGSRVGSVSDLVFDGQNVITHVVFDVGGFLGIGARTVALPIDDVDIVWAESTRNVRVQVPLTRDQLRDLPEFDS
ncbi:MAG: PRC-barrel domain-containing protein [Gemmobacter sp.]